MNPIVQKTIKQLSKATLSTEDRVALTNAIMDKLVILPIRKSFVISDDGIIINGKTLDQEQALNFRETCIALKDNYARKVMNEQIRYQAVHLGMNMAVSIDTLMFAKAALWIIEEEEKLLNQIT